MQLQHYVGSKIVEAKPHKKDGADGFMVRYKDGYVSWSPKAPFDEGYLALGDLSGLPDFLQRLIGERAKVASDLEKLQAMLEKPSDKITAEHLQLLKAQSYIMRDFVNILDKRLELLNTPAHLYNHG